MRALRSLLLLVVLGSATVAHATHNRAGEIIVCHLGGLLYEIKVITHTKLSAAAIHRYGIRSPGQTFRTSHYRISDEVST